MPSSTTKGPTDMSEAEWRRIADHLNDSITKGVYPPGGKLPSLQDLRATYGVSTKTIQMALIYLQGRGLVEPRHGVGFFVKADERATPDEPK